MYVLHNVTNNKSPVVFFFFFTDLIMSDVVIIFRCIHITFDPCSLLSILIQDVISGALGCCYDLPWI